MNALKKIAASARPASVVATFAAIFLAGCSALPQPPVRPVLYDLGPGQLAPLAAPADERPPLPALALADVQSAGPVDGSTAVHYRLAYADARQLRPYQSARWSQPPAVLLEQRLRAVLVRWQAGGAGCGPMTETERTYASDFAQAYQRHIALEEGVLYPAARALLSADDLREMGNEMAARRRRD